MNDHEINIAIAEACGWIAMPDGPDYLPPGSLKTQAVPSYTTDLNAMHEAENTLTEQQHAWYSDHLYDIACNYQKMTGKWRYLSLNARQRAEAFLRTLGKWKD